MVLSLSITYCLWLLRLEMQELPRYWEMGRVVREVGGVGKQELLLTGKK